MPNTDDTLALYLLTGSPNPSLATTKTLLFDFTLNYLNDNQWYIDTGILIPPTSGQCYLAIRYKTIVNWLDVKFDDIKITSNTSSGLTNIDKTVQFSIFPNPSIGKLNIQFLEKQFFVQCKLFDINGKLIKHQFLNLFSPGNVAVFDLDNFINGVYILQILTDYDETTYKIILSK